LVPGFTTFSNLGRGGKEDQGQELIKSRRGKGQETKCFLKKMEKNTGEEEEK
jgi:hypothetical protein